ncbi:MAG TPA: hypothetical protein DDX92_04815 [Flavobacteriales bacterium]|jgi:three-Cys-motif partner protein|nr:hypothetical protein [Flavobacteriales bacterium]
MDQKKNEQIQKFGGAWTVIKIDILKQYLDAYTTALKSQPFNLVYIDAFAGCGKYTTKNDQQDMPLLAIKKDTDIEVREGSARAALNITNPFHKYHFIDLAESNFEQLNSLKAEYSSISSRISIHREDANEAVLRICKETNWYDYRGVLFLDPFDLEVEWKTIETVAQTKGIDMWFLFPIMAVNRLLTRKELPPEEWQKKLDKVFGATDWRTSLYSKIQARQTSIYSLLPEDITVKDTDIEGIKEYTASRLRTVFTKVSPSARILRNKTNSPLFVLFFAVSTESDRGKEVAMRIANYILKNT